MKVSRSDIRRVRLSATTALFMLLAGLAAAWVSHHWYLDERRIAAAAEQQRKEIQTRLARAREEEAELKIKIGRFNDLSARGLIGEERRLDWIEQLARIRSERRLYDIQYELAPQSVLDAAAAPGSSGGYDFVTSSMHLAMPLLHEEDLLHLLDDLGNSVSAYVRPRRCTLERIRQRSAELPASAQLRAECTLDWITINPRGRAG